MRNIKQFTKWKVFIGKGKVLHACPLVGKYVISHSQLQNLSAWFKMTRPETQSKVVLPPSWCLHYFGSHRIGCFWEVGKGTLISHLGTERGSNREIHNTVLTTECCMLISTLPGILFNLVMRNIKQFTKWKVFIGKGKVLHACPLVGKYVISHSQLQNLSAWFKMTRPETQSKVVLPPSLVPALLRLT